MPMQPAVPYRQHNVHKALVRRIRAWHFTVLLLVTAAVTLLWSELQATAKLPQTQRHSFASDDEELEFKTVDDLLVAQIVQQCMQQQDTFIWLQRSSKGQQQLAVDDGRQPHKRAGGGVDGSCGPFHIPLASSDRSIGLCTDAALYVQLLGGWIAPATDAGLRHAQQCNQKSAVMFLEPLYEPWVAWLEQRKHVVAVFAPNFEQVAASDRAAHQRMQLILCKVHRCDDLMRKYLDELRSSAKLMYTGHTSLDPHVVRQLPPSTPTAAATISLVKRPKLPQQQQQQQRQPSLVTTTSQQDPSASAAASQQQKAFSLASATQPLRVLHVRGKSGLKHTKQLLECWLQHPDWPQLTVVGPMPNEQVSGDEAKKFLAAPNIRAVNPGKQQGPNWPAFEPLPLAELAELLLSHAVHILPSEREGFGHSINEGRAVGAVLLVPDHPPMNELVRGAASILLKPRSSFSHTDPPVPALGKHGNISVSMSPEAICAGMTQALSKSPEQLADMGKAARALFESDRWAFLEGLLDVQQELMSLLQVAEAAAKMDGA